MFKLHLKNAHSNEFQSKNELNLYCIKRRFELSKQTINEILCKYEKYSILHISEYYNLPYKAIVEIISSNEIELKGSSTISNLKSTRLKYKKTCKRNFGKDNVSKSEKIKAKKKETFLRNYGVDNIFKYEAFKKSLNEKMLKKHGVKRISGWYSLTKEQKEKQIKRLVKTKISNIEKRVAECLCNIGEISFKTQFKIKNKFYDFYLNELNLLIEVNGDFWHANPKIYKKNDILNFPKKKMKASELWKKDKEKANIAKKSNFNIITIWESDIKKMDDVELELYLCEQLKSKKSQK